MPVLKCFGWARKLLVPGFLIGLVAWSFYQQWRILLAASSAAAQTQELVLEVPRVLRPKPSVNEVDGLDRQSESSNPPVINEFFVDYADWLDFDAQKTIKSKYNINVHSVRTNRTHPFHSFFNPAAYPYPHLFPLTGQSAHELAVHLKDLLMKPGAERAESISRAVEQTRSKTSLGRFLMQQGFSRNTPVEHPLNASLISKYPVIVKPVRGAGSNDVRIVMNAEELERYVTETEKKIGRGNLVVQEVIANQVEHVALFAARHGRVSLLLCLRRDLGDPLRIYDIRLMKDEFWKIITYPCEQDGFLRTLLRKLDYTGLGCLQYRYRDMDPVVLDFNPRICAPLRRDEDLLARMLCAMQFEGRGAPKERTGCVDGGGIAVL